MMDDQRARVADLIENAEEAIFSEKKWGKSGCATDGVFVDPRDDIHCVPQCRGPWGRLHVAPLFVVILQTSQPCACMLPAILQHVHHFRACSGVEYFSQVCGSLIISDSQLSVIQNLRRSMKRVRLTPAMRLLHQRHFACHHRVAGAWCSRAGLPML
jgi:hypothetical protein